MADCQDCKKPQEAWLSCKGFEFYEPREIRFCPHQIIWLLQNIATLHEYSWVAGYEVSIPRRKKPSGGGYFETPADYAYEIERRLQHCRLDGLLVYLHYGFEFEERELAKYYRLQESEVRYRIEAVINWISGWNFYIDRPYRRWLAYRSYDAFLNKPRKIEVRI